MPKAIGSISRLRPAQTGHKAHLSKSLQPTRRLHHNLGLQHGHTQPALRPGPFPRMALHARQSGLPASAHMHDGHYVSAIPSSWRPLKQTAPGTSPYASSPSTVKRAPSMGDNGGSVTANKLQQQQSVRHVLQQQQDLPGTSRHDQQQRQAGPWQVEARQRGKQPGQPSSQEPVFSYQQLFSQETSPPGGRTKQQQPPPMQPPQQQGRGFGKSKSRKSGGGSAAAGATPSGAQEPPQDNVAAPGAADVRFCITRHLEYGQNLRMTGSSAQLGAWDSSKGPKLKWSEGDKWSADVILPPGGYEFKFLLEHRSGYLEWENGNNRSFTVPKTAAQVQVVGHWGSTEDTEVLELQQQAAYTQQMQQLQQRESELEAAQRELEATARAEAAAFAAANKAAAAAYQQQAEAEAAAAAAGAATAPVAAVEPPRVPAELFAFDVSLLDSDIPGHQQLLQVLQGFRKDMIEGLTGVTSTMQEIQEELSQVQQMSRLSSERFLQQQALAAAVDGSAAASMESGAAATGQQGPGGLTAATAAIIAADAAVAQEQALSGLQGALQTWQQELGNFRQDSVDMRQELEQLRVSLESQMAENTAAVHDLELLVKQLMGMDISTTRPSPVVATAAVATPPQAAPADVAGSNSASSSDGSWSLGAGGDGPPESSELLDPEDKMLLERINHLASDLSAEMKEAVQELEVQQQSLFERHQHIIADMSISSNNKNRTPLDLGFGAGLGMRMQPTIRAGAAGASSSSLQPAAGPHVTRSIARWLESRDVQQYHRGLLLAVMVSCGLWQDSMWEQMEGGALRATFSAYKSVWSEACLQTWKDSISTKQALLTALSSGRQQLLSMHILWSLQELSTHSSTLRQLLSEVATPIELGLMQKLRQKGAAGQGWALGVAGAPVGGGEAAAAAQCAVLLQRWLAAADGKW